MPAEKQSYTLEQESREHAARGRKEGFSSPGVFRGVGAGEVASLSSRSMEGELGLFGVEPWESELTARLKEGRSAFLRVRMFESELRGLERRVGEAEDRLVKVTDNGVARDEMLAKLAAQVTRALEQAAEAEGVARKAEGVSDRLDRSVSRLQQVQDSHTGRFIEHEERRESNEDELGEVVMEVSKLKDRKVLYTVGFWVLSVMVLIEGILIAVMRNGG